MQRVQHVITVVENSLIARFPAHASFLIANWNVSLLRSRSFVFSKDKKKKEIEEEFMFIAWHGSLLTYVFRIFLHEMF